MRAALTALILSAATALAQREDLKDPARMIWVDKLVIESKTLPDQDRIRLERCFEHHIYPQPELQERIRGFTRDLGYFQTVVDEPRIVVRGGKADCARADVIVSVAEGSRYRVGRIRFLGAKVFSIAQLEEAFAIHEGDTLSTSQISRGQEALRTLYSNQGYLNFVAAPVVRIDNAAHVIHFDLQMDEGSSLDLGDLVLDGVEAHPGAATALQRSWTELRGRRYDPRLLDRWLQANQSNCPGCTRSRDIDLEYGKPDTVTTRLRLHNQHWSASQPQAVVPNSSGGDVYCTSPPVSILR